MPTLTPESSSLDVQISAGNPVALAMREAQARPVAEPMAADGSITTPGISTGKAGGTRMKLGGKAGTRQSQSPGQAAVNAGGIGYIARRGVPYRTALLLRSVGGVEGLAEFQPLELLQLCADLIPEVSQAVWNFLLLGCSPGFCTLSAVVEDEKGGSEEAPDGTALINQFFENQPQESGDFNQQLVSNTLMVLFSGMAATEYVPGPEGSGKGESYPTDTLTLIFKRDKATKQLVLEQKQLGPVGQGQITANSSLGTNFIPMPMERFFWDSIHRFPDDPYGRAPFGAALTPIFDYLAFVRDLTLAFHRIGMPRYDVTFDFAACIEFVTKVKQLSDPDDISDAVQKEYFDFIDTFNSLDVDDAFFHPVGTDVETTGSGTEMPDIEGIFDIYRYRIIIALKQNPVLMSYVEGSTETWSEIQWEAFNNGLKAIVTPAASPLKDSAQLHLQLMGKPYKVVTKFASVSVVNPLQNAQAEQIQIGNEAEKRDQGWQTQDSASQKMTGSASVTEPPPTLSEQDKQAKADKQAQQQQAANALKAKQTPPPAKKK